MSRDIRMPLHIILGRVEIIRNNHDDPEMLQKKYLDGIKISGEYMMSMFDRLLNERCCKPSNMSTTLQKKNRPFGAILREYSTDQLFVAF